MVMRNIDLTNEVLNQHVRDRGEADASAPEQPTEPAELAEPAEPASPAAPGEPAGPSGPSGPSGAPPTPVDPTPINPEDLAEDAALEEVRVACSCPACISGLSH